MHSDAISILFIRLIIFIFIWIVSTITQAAGGAIDPTDAWGTNGGPTSPNAIIVNSGEHKYFDNTIWPTKEIWVRNGTLSGDRITLGFDDSMGTLRMNSGNLHNSGDLVIKNGLLSVAGGLLESESVLVEDEGIFRLSGGIISTKKLLIQDGGRGNVIFNGGTIQAQQAEQYFFDGPKLSAVRIEGGGGVIDANGYDIGIFATGGGFTGEGELKFVNSKMQSPARILLNGDGHSGATVIDQGITLAQTKENAFSGSSLVHIKNGAKLDLGGFNGAIGGLSGEAGSTVINTGPLPATLTIRSIRMNEIFHGNIQDFKPDQELKPEVTLSINKTGTGKLILAGNNSYSGHTQVFYGSLSQGNLNGFSPKSSIILHSGTELDLNGFDARIADLSGGGITAGSQVVNRGSSLATLTIETDFTGAYAGRIHDQNAPLAIKKIGNGTQIFWGNNNYTGGTIIEKGHLFIGFDTTTGSVSGDVRVDKDATLHFRRSDDYTFSGKISGEGAVAQEGGGVLTFTGQNDYSGDTQIFATTLKQGTENALSPRSRIRMEEQERSMLGLRNEPANIWREGESSVLDLGGFDGAIGGLVGIHNSKVTNSGLGLVKLRVNVPRDQDVFQGKIEDGTGGISLLKTGPGSLVLSGENSYMGGTVIQEGVLQIGNGGETGSIKKNVDIEGSTAVLAFNRSNSYTFEGEISGNGWIEKRGSGSLTLSGTNSYTGGTQIIEGALIGTTSSLQGLIGNNTTLIFDQDFPGVFHGSIVGDGEVVVKNQKGLINFNQDQPRIGTLRIESGQVAVNARINSKLVTIENLGALSGAGIIAGVETQKLKVINNGLVSPGNPIVIPGNPIERPIGTLSIKGDYTQTSEGKLLIEIAENGHDKLDVEGGKATLDGTIQVKTIGGYVPRGGSEFIVVEAEEGVEGQFATEELEKLPGSLKLRVVYNDPNDKDGKGSNRVKIKTVQKSFAATGTTASQKSVGEALDEAIETGKARDALGEAIWAMEFVPREMLGPYLEYLMPTMAISIKEVFLNAANAQCRQLSERLAAVREGGIGEMSLHGLNYEPMAQQVSKHEIELKDRVGYMEKLESSSWNLFANASGIFSKITSAADLPRQNAVTGYFSAGGDYRINQQISTGIYGGYQGIKSWYADGSRLRSNGVKFGFYGMGEWNHFYVDAMIGSGFHGLELKRTINMGAKQWVAESQPTVWEINSLLGGGYELPVGPWRFGLNTSVQHTYLGISGFQESGARNLGVRLGRQNPNSLVSTLGGSIAYRWELTPNYVIIPKVGLSWQHEFLNYGEKIPGAFLNGPGFQLTSAAGARNNAFGSAGVMAQLGRKIGIYCYYNPQFGGGDVLSHAFLFGLNYSF